MLYTLFWHEFSLPGATTNQYSFRKYDSMAEFIDEILYELSENRDVICNLDGDEVAEEVDECINSLVEEDIILSDQNWTFGSFDLRICFAKFYPEILKGFKETVMKGIDSRYSSVMDHFKAYKALESVNENMSEEEFAAVFDILMDTLGEEAVF